MAFTFPTDTNNKAGAVRTKGTGTSYVLPVQDDNYDTMEIKRAVLVANTNTQLTLSAESVIEVHNMGTGDVFVRLDGVATVNGANCVLIPDGVGYRFPINGTVVNVISTGTPNVQVVGVRNNA